MLTANDPRENASHGSTVVEGPRKAHLAAAQLGSANLFDVV